MNKQEAIKKTEELEKQLAELKAIIEAPETSELVFKPEDYETYCVVNNTGGVGKEKNKLVYYIHDVSRISIGNCFRTEEDARNSAKYYIMNSEYDYWFPWSGQPKPKVLPKGLEYWSTAGMCWGEAPEYWDLDNIESGIYRWKRSEQGEK